MSKNASFVQHSKRMQSLRSSTDADVCICVQIADMALVLRDATAAYRPPLTHTARVQVRIGIHSGPCMAGVVGKKMPR